MKLSDFLVTKATVFDLKADSKESVIRELVEALCEAGEISLGVLDDVTESLLNREKLASTAIGKGVAVPHAKHPCVNQLVGVVGRSGLGVDFDSSDGEPVNAVFLLLSPPDSTGPHLRALEQISLLCGSDNLCQLIRNTPDRESLEAVLRDAYKK